MALIVQDPVSPVNNSNTYQSLIDGRALAATYAITLPVDDIECETALINGFVYIQGKESELQGSRTTEIQNSAYPRKDTKVRGVDVPEDSLPSDLLISQLMAAEAFGQGVNLFGGADDGLNVASKTAGKVSISYFDNGNTGDAPTYGRFDKAFQPLIGAVTGLFPIGGQIAYGLCTDTFSRRW